MLINVPPVRDEVASAELAAQDHPAQVNVDHLVLGDRRFGEELSGEHDTRIVDQDA